MASKFKTTKMKKIMYLATASLVCCGLLFTSCKKKEAEDNDTAGAEDSSLGETHSNDITNIGTQASYGNMSTYRNGQPDEIYTGCAVIKFDTIVAGDPDTMTVDFGTGCVGGDGRSRKGILQFTHTHGKHYRDSGNVITVSTPLNTYYVGDGNMSNWDQVIINSKTITNMGHVLSNGGRLTWNVSVNMQVNRANGNVATWTANKTKVLLAGEMPNNQPIDWPHAQVAMYGSGSGSHTKSGGSAHSFNMNVQQSKWLVRDFNCSASRKHFVAGTLEMTPSGKPTRYVDFGSGNCDNIATVTINGHVYTITLK